MMNTNKYIILKNSKFIKISGPDSDVFLQGMITNDINKCSNTQAIYSAFLTPQGKFIADFFILKLDDGYLFEINSDQLKNLVDKLNIYKLKAKLNIEENNDYVSLTIDMSNSLFNNLKEIGQLEKINNGYAFIDPRNKKLGLKVILKRDELRNFCLKYNLETDTLKNYDYKRIKLNIPDSSLDLEYNKSLLLENNFDNMNAIDWDKGCYVGQEITARMKYRSLLKKSLTKIIIIKGNVKSGDEIFLNNKKIGNISSINNDIGLAMMRIEDSKNAYDNKIELNTKNGKILVNF